MPTPTGTSNTHLPQPDAIVALVAAMIEWLARDNPTAILRMSLVLSSRILNSAETAERDACRLAQEWLENLRTDTGL